MKQGNEVKNFPAQHIPDSTLVKIPTELLLLKNQSLTKESLTVKQVTSLYFSNDTRCQIIEKNGNDVMVIPINLLYDGERTSSYFIERSFKSFKDGVQETAQNLAARKGKELITEFNYLELTPQIKKRFGIEGSDTTIVTIIQQVDIGPENMLITFSSFMQLVKSKLLNGQLSNSLLIAANANDVIKFSNVRSLDFYYFIASCQHYTNSIVITIDRLKEILSYKGESDFSTFKRRILESVVNDQILINSTCALKEVTANGKSQKYTLIRKGGTGVSHIKFDFKDNRELAQELLNLNYKFIKHLKDTKLNQAALIQIIARVKDQIISEQWVNYVINNSYDYFKKTKNNPHSDIGALVWSHIKDGRQNEEYTIHPHLWELSNTIGMSITEERKLKQEQTQLIPSQSSDKNKPNNTDVYNYYVTDKGVLKEDLDYLINSFGVEGIAKKVKVKPKGMTYRDYLHQLAYNDFKSSFANQIKEIITQSGFKGRNVKLIFSYLDDSNEALQTLFTRFDIQFNKIEVNDTWLEILKDQFRKVLIEIDNQENE